MTTLYQMTPKEIVEELDKYIIGQNSAKKSVAVALRNRYRRSLLPEEMKEEITPKNILMIGSTGVGKTEIARRLAKLADAPFVKVEASKYSQVGYVGKDVDSMVRDLVEASIRLTKQKRLQEKYSIAENIAEEKIIEAIIPGKKKPQSSGGVRGPFDFIMGGNFQPNQTQQKSEQKPENAAEQADIDMEQVTAEALENAEQNGIIFIDEIDKIASSNNYTSGADVSREGVQRDILPIVEGSVVNTKYGPVKTDHMLFIGAGAFYISKPTDLIPELQGRFPIRVELENLTKEDFVQILTVPENALLKQHKMLLETEGVKVTFTDDAVDEVATIAFLINEQSENIGARRLHTVLEKLLEEISFSLPDETQNEVLIDEQYVKEKFADRIQADDIERFIL